MKIASILVAIAIAIMYWFGLSINHIVILTCFAASIFFGAIVISDSEEDKN